MTMRITVFRALFSVCFLLAIHVAPSASQATFHEDRKLIAEKFRLGNGPARIPPGTPIPSGDEFAEALLEMRYNPPITTVEGNSSSDGVTVLRRLTLSTEPPPEIGVSGLNSGFVKASGSQFVLNGRTYYCAGTNAYYGALKYLMSDNEVDVMMKEHASRGATVLRIFAHSNFDSVPQAMMPWFGSYDNEAIKRLDLVLVSAAKHGIRLVLCLGNVWPFNGGIQSYVDKGVGIGKNASLFYTDATLRQHYKDWVQNLVTRTNTITGQKYVDDPTIFAWQLLNEPRPSLKPDGGYEQSKGLQPGKTVCDWVHEMASYIKSLDPNHMVSTGEEGYRTDGNTQDPNSWLNNGYKNVDFTCDTQTPEIDYATIHSYPDQWNLLPPLGYQWLAENFYRDRAEVAHRMGKPIVLEEYGQKRDYYGPREALLSWTHDRANENDYACTLIWAVAHYSLEGNTSGQLLGNDTEGYVFGYDGDGAQAVMQQYAYMKAKTDGTAHAPGPQPLPEPAPSSEYKAGAFPLHPPALEPAPSMENSTDTLTTPTPEPAPSMENSTGAFPAHPPAPEPAPYMENSTDTLTTPPLKPAPATDNATGALATPPLEPAPPMDEYTTVPIKPHHTTTPIDPHPIPKPPPPIKDSPNTNSQPRPKPGRQVESRKVAKGKSTPAKGRSKGDAQEPSNRAIQKELAPTNRDKGYERQRAQQVANQAAGLVDEEGGTSRLGSACSEDCPANNGSEAATGRETASPAFFA